MCNSTTPTKKCTKCGNEFPATHEYFGQDKSKSDDLCSWCKSCKQENARSYDRKRRNSDPNNFRFERHQQTQAGMKICPKCRREFPETSEYFYTKSHSKSGYSSRCKSCTYTPRPQPNIPDGMKQCSKCHEILLATSEYFYGEKLGKYGLRSTCKNCERGRIPPDKRHEYDRRHYAKYPERRREKSRRWRINNPEKKQEYSHRYTTEHPEETAAKSRNRRAREANAEGTHTAADIEAQLKRQRGKCYYCGCKLTKKPNRPNSSTVDHVIPLTRPGTSNAPDNLVIACATCNSRKGTKLPHEWAEGGRLL